MRNQMVPTRLYFIMVLLIAILPSYNLFAQCSAVPVEEAVRNGDFELGYLPGPPMGASGTMAAASHTFTPGGPLDFWSDLDFPGEYQGSASTCWYNFANFYGVAKIEDPRCLNGNKSIPLADYHTADGNYTDHTTGTEDGYAFFFDFNKGDVSWEVVWGQKVNVHPSQLYYFSAWFGVWNNTGLSLANAPELRFRVEFLDAADVVINNTLASQLVGTASPTQGWGWQQFSDDISSPVNAVTANIYIECDPTGLSGADDLILDDISFINSCENIAANINYDITFDDDSLNLCYEDGSVTAQIKDDGGTNLTNAGKTITWYEGTGGSQTELVALANQVAPVFTSEGVYRACVTDPVNSGCAVNATIELVEDFSIPLNNITLCSPATAVIDAGLDIPNNTMTSIAWTGSGAHADRDYTVDQNGNHTVTVVSDPAYNCGFSGNFNVTSNLPVDPGWDYCPGIAKTFSVDGSTSYCYSTTSANDCDLGTGITSNSHSFAGPGTQQIWVQNTETSPLPGSPLQTSVPGSDGKTADNMTITVTQTVYLASVQVDARSYATGNAATITIGGNVANITTAVGGTFALGWTLTPGNYTISYSGTQASRNGYGNANFGGTIPGYVTVDGIDPVFYNFVFEESNACDPVAFDVVESSSCCGPPTAVSITTGDPLDLCVGDNSTINGSQTLGVPVNGGYYYSWWKDGSQVVAPTTTATTSHALNSVATGDAGTYTYRVEDGNNANPSCYLEGSINVNVDDVPSGTPTIAPSADVCVGDVESYTASGVTNATAYTWTLPGNTSGTSTTSSINVTFNSGTSANLQVTPTNTCGSGTQGSQLININDVPSAPVFSAAQNTVCESSTGAVFTVTNDPTATYTWNYTGTGETINGSGNSVTIDFGAGATPGNVEVTANNSCGSSSTTVEAVSVDPPAGITTQPSSTSICEGDNHTFSVVATGTGLLTYQWFKDGSSLSDGGVISGSGTADLTITGATAMDAGDYHVVVTASCGPIQSSTVTLTIDPNTTITTHPSDDVACVGDPSSFTVVAAGTGVLTYTWDFGGSTVGGNSDTYSIASVATGDAGNYSVTVSGGCGSDVTSNLAALTVNEAPAITTDPVDVGVCAGSNAGFSVVATGTGPLSYQWRKDGSNLSDGGVIFGATSANLSLTNVAAGDAGNYDVVVTNSCGTATSAAAVFTITLTEFPAVSISVDNDRICEGESVTFTANGSGTGAGPTYSFYEQGNAVALQTGASTTYNTAALSSDLTVYVELNSNSSCLDIAAVNPINSTDQLVTVVAPPAAAVINEPAQDICTADFNLTAPDAGTWSTDIGTLSANSGLSTTLTIPTEATTATVTLTTSTGTECPDDQTTVQITRVGSMTTPAAGSDQLVCEGTSVTLAANNSLQPGETGTWTLPAGISLSSGTLNDFDAQVSASGPGTYTLTWTLDNGGVCNNISDDVEIQVDEAPTNVNVAGANLTVCLPNLVLNASTPSPVTSVGVWSLVSETNAGEYSAVDVNDPTTQVTVGDGTTDLTWTVTNGVCAPVAVNLSIEKLGDVTEPTITIDGGTYTNEVILGNEVELCLSTAYTIDGNVPTGVGENGTWLAEVGTSATLNPGGATAAQSLTLNSTGTTTVTWEISSTVPGCAPVTKIVDLIVNDVPVQPGVITESATGDICEGESRNYSISPVPTSSSYSWTVPNGATGTPAGTSIDIEFNSPGSGNVTVEAENQCGTSPAQTIPYTVVPLAEPSIAITSNLDGDVCFGEEITFQGGVPVNEGTSPSYTWFVNGSAVLGNTSLTYITSTLLSLTNPNEIYLQLTASSEMCNTDPVAVSNTIEINPLNPSVIISADAGACENDNVTFTTTTTNGGSSPSYQWYVEGSPEGSNSSTFATTTLPVGQNLDVMVEMTTSIGCTAPPVSHSVEIDVFSNPIPSITIDSNTICLGMSLPITSSTTALAPTYVWQYDGTGSGTFTDVTGATSASYNASQAGDYKVLVTNGGLCTSESNEINLEVLDVQITSVTATPELIEEGASSQIIVTDNCPTCTVTWTDLTNGGVVGGTRIETVSPIDATTYEVVVGRNGCSATGQTEVQVYKLPEIPNVISPNGDGVNDQWNIKNIETFPSARVMVLNRWGNVLYETYKGYADDPWDGTRNGKPLPVGTYYYVIELLDVEEVPPYRGFISLIK